jgi:hypothetical protein
MRWIYTASIAAQVVEREVSRDWTDKQSVDDAMGSVLFVIEAEAAVAFFTDVASP